MANGTGSEAIDRSAVFPTPSNPWSAFSRYGLPGLVIAVLFFFMWADKKAAREDMKEITRVISDNSRVMIQMEGAVVGMKDALKSNTEAVNRLREERRNR